MEKLGWRGKAGKRFVFNELSREERKGPEKRNGLQGFTWALHGGFVEARFRGFFFTLGVKFRGK